MVKKDYQPRANIVKDETGDLFTGFHSILVRWRNHFCQLFKVRTVISGSLSLRHGASSGCGWRNGLQYVG